MWGRATSMKLAVFCLGACLCIASVPGQAQDSAPAAPPGDLAAALLAAEQDPALVAFRQAHEAITGTLLQEGTLPGLDDPVYAGAVAQAFDVSLLDKDLLMPNLIGACNAASATQAVYIIHGARKEDLDPFAIQPRLKPEPTAGTTKLKRENYLRFQNEQIAALGFLLACRTRELEKLSTYLDQMSHDEMVVFRLGFADFQDSLVETVTYHAQALGYPIRPENRQAVLDLLVQSADPLAAGMTKLSRRSAAASVRKMMTASAVSPDERKRLQTVLHALNRKDCGRVCSFR